ncbi:hypothetical protein [Mameliella alba]|uniref:hypothetical protein n=1 Tax=Mameliella alba TaxID=561184 RepID=UPI0014305BDF|nr:hypothetical protein [Mameliella alba]
MANVLNANRVMFLDDRTVQYRFEVYGLEQRPSLKNVVYAFVANGSEPIKYIGKANDLAIRLSSHDKLVPAIMLGATELWVHVPGPTDRIGHEEAEERLIRSYSPPLNKMFAG